MSSYIKCQLEIKSLDMIKKVLDIMELSYQEGDLTAKGYNTSKNVELLVKQSELNKMKAGRYGDMGFKCNENGTYDIFVDDMDRKLVDTINKLYAIESIKNFATANRKSYSVVSGMDSVMSKQEVVIDVFV